MDKMFSNFDLQKITGAKVMLYNELSNVKDIEKYLPLIILYDVCPHYGHWTCVFNQGDKIEFFDSLGVIPDDELRIMGSGNSKPLLLRLLHKTGKKIIYNHRRLQRSEEGINTCGRWVIARLFTKDYPLETFLKIFDTKKADELVTELTKNL